MPTHSFTAQVIPSGGVLAAIEESRLRNPSTGLGVTCTFIAKLRK